MPIFELDAGRPVLVQPMQPASGTFPQDTSSVVADHLGSLLGEQLFPVATRQHGADGPHLLAVDAAGQPVVVEVVQMLDSAALVRALQFAGAAAQLSSADLARAYHGGPERFATDLVAFRENVPVAVAHAAARHAGARLLLVCSDVAENIVGAVEFLRQPGRQVDVLQVGVLHGTDGRRFVDVSPLVSHVPKRRAVEPSPLRTVRASEELIATPAHGVVLGSDEVARPAALGGSRGPGRPVQGRVESRSDRRGRASGSPAPAERAPEPRATGPVPSAGAAAPTGTFPSVLPVPVGPVFRSSLAPIPMLAAFGTELATTTTLVWARQRRGQRLVATLRVDGLIQLPDGAVFAEPDAAAAAAARSEYPIDGWQVWRVGDDGPTLAEVRAM
jgi:hypothetical protein